MTASLAQSEVGKHKVLVSHTGPETDSAEHFQGVLKSRAGDERVVLKKVKARVEVRP